MDIATQKKILRQEMRKKLTAIDVGLRTAASCEIVKKITSASAWREAQSVLLFSPLASEPDISVLFGLALSAGKNIFYPRVSGAALEIYQVRGSNELVTGSFDILEPNPALCPCVRSSVIDFALVPGLAFDAAGRRLGRGKGYYDRFLSQFKGKTVGVCFACQKVAKVPAEQHDIRLDCVVTE